jgi:hypothetical protein
MTNSDNTYGTFNKTTQVLTQINDGSEGYVATSFATVDEAKAFFYKAEALAVFDECCTELEWSLVDSTALKYTFTFGTKGGEINEADDWAGQFVSRKQALIDADGWANNGYITQEVETHLF